MMRHAFCGALCSFGCVVASGVAAQSTGDWSVAAARAMKNISFATGLGTASILAATSPPTLKR